MRNWALLCMLAIGLCGCTGWPDIRGPGFGGGEKEFAKLGARKQDGSDLSAFGVSGKAREIEQNLGAR
jgi:hypothetical protein